MHKALFAILACLAFALPALAQDTEPSPTAEPFSVLPNRVNKGAQGVKLLFSAASKDLFASTSVKAPELAFGEGVTLVDGSFKVLNSGEAEATVNVAEDAIGGILVRISFFSRDGTTVTRQEQATIGVIGDTAIGDTGLMISADRVQLVAVNVADVQKLGAVLISGRVSGVFTYTPPAGMLFEAGETPVVTINGGGSISNINVANGRGSVSFTVINTDSATVTVRIDNLMVDTESFGASGGALGNQASTLTGTSLADSEGLVINAHTALATLKGEEVVDETPEATDDTTSEGTTENEAAGNTSNNSSNNNSSSSSTNRSNNNSSNANNNNNNSNRDAERARRRAERDAARRAAANTARNAPTGQPRISNRWGNRGTNNPPRGSSRFNSPPPRGFSGGRSGAGSASGEEMYERYHDRGDTTGGADDPVLSLSDEAVTKRLVRSQRLYFADKNYKRQDSLLLTGKRAIRTWIVLERETDISDQIDTVEVQLAFGGLRQTVRLVETGPKTGIFRSDKDGIEVTVPAAE